jgi:predicted small lipoprotein YifL
MRRVAPALALAGITLALAACGSDGPVPTAPSASPTAAPTSTSERLPAAATEAALLDAVFRIDVDRIEVVFDLYPAERRAHAQAAVTFRMRPGQARPIVHFEPARSASGVALRLDGQDLDPARASDVRLFSYDGSGQVSVELQRDLAAGVPHRLEASYPLALADAGGRFFADVNDIEGRGNEAVFPTLNVPHELARHLLVFRVHGAEPYVAVGSGLLAGRSPGDVQEWTLDTEREVASYTVMFHLAPARTHALSDRRIRGVDVRVLAPTGGVTAEEAFATLDPWLAELQGALGPFPMPRGLSVVLTQTGGGMEYYGATTTSLRALRHEVFHMYFACSTVARTYRDSWWDEAIDMWYELSADPAYAPIDPGYRSDIVSGRSAVAVGFDRRAYDQGSRIMQAVAAEMGGRERMVRFLRELHARRSFDPFTTWDLADEIRAASGVDVRERFRLWLYSSPASQAGAPAASAWDWLHRVDTALPGGESVRAR